jgi:heme exporter protein C
MLFQFFLLISVISLRSALNDSETAAKACAVLSIVGCVNVVVIKYSVEWWNTLHQPASALSMDGGSVNGPEFWVPTLIMVVAMYLFMAVHVMMATRNEILRRESRAQWVQDLMLGAR